MIAAALLAIVLQQPRDVPQRVQGSGTISVVVVSDDADAAPVRHAKVMCTGAAIKGQTGITDDRGRVVFAGLPAGRYSVGATKTAWLTAWYGARRPMRAGAPVPLSEGQHLDLVLRLPHGAVLGGVVLDVNGQPAASASVQAMHYAYVAGERRLVPAGSLRTTDDRGVYRLYGLPPGDYLVQAAGSGVIQELSLTTDLDLRYAASPARTAPPPLRTVKMGATYYPVASNPSQASVVSLRAAEERTDVDIQMQLEPTVRIEGTVAAVDAAGVPPGTQVLLTSTSPSASGGAAVEIDDRRSVGTTGAFVFPNLAPGNYTLIARASKETALPDGRPGPPQTLWGSVDLAVEGEPATGIVISMQPGMRVSGRVRFAGTGERLPDMSSVRITLQSIWASGPFGLQPDAVSPQRDGRFTVTGVLPGQYRLVATVTGSPRDRWMPQSSVIDGQDTLDVPVAIHAGQNTSGAEIVLTDRPARLSGVVTDASGNPAPGVAVVLFPASPALWTAQSRRIRGARPSADGVYTIPNLPAGDYLIAVAEDAEDDEWFDPALLQRLAPAGMKIAIAEGAQKVQHVRSGGGGVQ